MFRVLGIYNFADVHKSGIKIVNEHSNLNLKKVSAHLLDVLYVLLGY